MKELYYYLDATPTASYLRGLYKYPQAAYPYDDLVAENRRRGRDRPEYELVDTGVLDGGRYFDVSVEYAKASPDDILVLITVSNRGPDAAPIHVLPTLWFRNTWAWGRRGEGHTECPTMERTGPSTVVASHEQLDDMLFHLDTRDQVPELLFTNNETNTGKLFGVPAKSHYTKDAFHEYVIGGHEEALNPDGRGTKAAGHYRFVVPAHSEVKLRARLVSSKEDRKAPFDAEFDATFAARKSEADAFYASVIPELATPDERAVARQAHAGLIWSKQFYHYAVTHWLEGDPCGPRPPEARKYGRNKGWDHLYNRDVLSMPDKWEYPWFAAWDLAFHMVPFARTDPGFAKEQLTLLLREWYMHPNGQLPAYEFAFGDVNPPVHAWSAWRVYKMTGRRGHRDVAFLARVFQKLLLNFTWWVNRKDTKAIISSRAASLASTTSASSTAPSRCPPVVASSRRTARRGWRSTP